MAIEFDLQNSIIYIDGVAIANASGVVGNTVQVTPYGTITATDLQSALEQLADQSFRGDSTPSGTNIEEGDVWYDTANDNFYVYRETSIGIFQWVPIILGKAGDDSDTLDGGAF